jgi:uncharacterized protein YjbI with pentapeptide repeats
MSESTTPVSASTTCSYTLRSGETCAHPRYASEDLCFWHSRSADKSSDDIKQQLEEMCKRGDNLEGFQLKGVNLYDAFLIKGKMKDVNLTRANIEKGHLFNIDLEGADLFKTSFMNSNLKHANLKDANVLGTQFNEAKLGRINWGPHEKLQSEIKGRIALKKGDREEAMKQFLEAEESYRDIKNNYKDRGIATQGGKFFYREMIMKRLQLPMLSLERFYSLLLDLACGYGEKPFRIISFSIGVILLNAVIYGSIGLDFSGTTMQFSTTQSVIENVLTYLNACYFSVVTFTTLGFGDFLPISVAERLIAGIQAYMGAFLMSLFVITVYKNMMER